MTRIDSYGFGVRAGLPDRCLRFAVGLGAFLIHLPRPVQRALDGLGVLPEGFHAVQCGGFETLA